MHDTVMAEFGDSTADVPVGIEGPPEDSICLVEIQSQPQGAEMTLEA
jgi:hypothetical protein